MKFKLCFLLFLLYGTVFADKPVNKCPENHSSVSFLKHIKVDIDKDILVLTCDNNAYNWVEITPAAKLYINGEQVRLTRNQEYMVREYYEYFIDFIDQAKEIGIEGAKIGIKGVKVGFLAVEGLLKVALTDYDSEDFEEDMEEENDRLEDNAEELEELAEELEESAETLEELHVQLKHEIDELNQLTWF